MAMTLSGAIRSDLSLNATNAFDLANGSVPLRNKQTQTISSTAATLTCNLIYQVEGTLGLAGVDNIDLDSVLFDYWGDALDYDEVYAIYIRNTTTGAGAGESILSVGANATPFPWCFGNPAACTVEISPGGFVLSSAGVDAGWAVGAGATDILDITNLDAANAATYEIVIIGKE